MEIKKLKEETIKEYGRIIQGDYFEPLPRSLVCHAAKPMLNHDPRKEASSKVFTVCHSPSVL